MAHGLGLRGLKLRVTYQKLLIVLNPVSNFLGFTVQGMAFMWDLAHPLLGPSGWLGNFKMLLEATDVQCAIGLIVGPIQGWKA